MRRNTLKRLAAAALLLSTSMLHAQHHDGGADYPQKPIRIVVPFAAGGATDVLARILGQKVSPRLGQAVIVENKPGAASNLGARFAAKAPPDGYTLFLGTSTGLAVNPHLYPNLGFDPHKDFAPIILATTLPMLVVVNNAVPAKTLGEFNSYAKMQARNVTYASNGAGTPPHLGAELYARAAGIQMTHVPYRGGAPALTDLAGGQTSVMFAVLPDALPLVKDGRIRALAVTTAQRSALVPDLPTVTEAAVPGFELNAWYGFLAPTGTPKPVLAKLNKALGEALQDQEVREKLQAMGYVVEGGAPDRLTDLMRSESKKWGDVIRAADIKAD